MSPEQDTIVALSSGQGRAGVAVIRVSGPACRFIAETILDKPLVARRMTLVTLREPTSSAIVDRCLAVRFDGPASATGEDVLELHVHGGPAIIATVLRALTNLGERIRLAQPGEFTRRAFEHGKLDLVQVEALGDALEAKGTAQLLQAQRLLGGALSRQVDTWVETIVELRSRVEAELDFSDEGDVIRADGGPIRAPIHQLAGEIARVLAGSERGRLVREGARIVLAGAPNVGKSSLLNALASQEIAIVTDQPGTTRDVLVTPMVLKGWPVLLIDIAGLRETADPVEAEGVRRARREMAEADLVVELVAPGIPALAPEDLALVSARIRVGTKGDVGRVDGVDLTVSAHSGEGLETLAELILQRVFLTEEADPPLVARERHRQELMACRAALLSAADAALPELAAEALRQAQMSLGRLKGHVDVERVLDRLFSSFCIGK